MQAAPTGWEGRCLLTLSLLQGRLGGLAEGTAELVPRLWGEAQPRVGRGVGANLEVDLAHRGWDLDDFTHMRGDYTTGRRLVATCAGSVI